MTNVIHRQFVQLPGNEEERLIGCRGTYVSQLFHCLTGLGYTKNAPTWVKLILETQAWKERRSELGRIVCAGSIYDLVHAEAPQGMGSDYDTVRKLIQHDPEVLALWLKAIEGDEGGDKKTAEAKERAKDRKGITVYNVHDDPTERPSGNSRARAIKQLWEAREDGDPEASKLWDQVTAGKLSPHKAAIEMGWRKQRTPYQELCAAWRRASEQERGQFENYITEWRRREPNAA